MYNTVMWSHCWKQSRQRECTCPRHSASCDNPLTFWRQAHFPSLQLGAKKHLTHSTASVPIENLFSTTGLMLNGKRSSLPLPPRSNWVAFIHGKYKLYFDINV